MTWQDGIILGIVLLIVASIIFFRFFYKRSERKGTCSSCPIGAAKKGKRLVKDFHREEKKQEK